MSTATLIPAVAASRNSHGNGDCDCDQNPDRYRDGDSNRHSNSNTAPNSNSHSIGHIYGDGYRYAIEAPTATSTPTVAPSCGHRSVSSCVPKKTDHVRGIAKGNTRVRGEFDLLNAIQISIWTAYPLNMFT
jgi:hypothetical protein